MSFRIFPSKSNYAWVYFDLRRSPDFKSGACDEVHSALQFAGD